MVVFGDRAEPILYPAKPPTVAASAATAPTRMAMLRGFSHGSDNLDGLLKRAQGSRRDGTAFERRAAPDQAREGESRTWLIYPTTIYLRRASASQRRAPETPTFRSRFCANVSTSTRCCPVVLGGEVYRFITLETTSGHGRRGTRNTPGSQPGR